MKLNRKTIIKIGLLVAVCMLFALAQAQDPAGRGGPAAGAPAANASAGVSRVTSAPVGKTAGQSRRPGFSDRKDPKAPGGPQGPSIAFGDGLAILDHVSGTPPLQQINVMQVGSHFLRHAFLFAFTACSASLTFTRRYSSESREWSRSDSRL